MENDHISELLHRFERELQILEAEDDICKIFDIIKEQGKSLEEIKLVVQKFSELYETEFSIEIYKEEPHPELDISKEHYHVNYDSIFPMDDWDIYELIGIFSDSSFEIEMFVEGNNLLHIILNTEEELERFTQLIDRIVEEVKNRGK